MENERKPDARLLAAADYVREGSVIADIGTDHGYLPVYLLTEGRIPFAYAADINPMPLEKAGRNAAKYGVADKIALRLSDGLRFLDDGETENGGEVDDIVICGMGGELIAKILAASPYSRRKGVRLILQPMTMADRLRAYLAEAGYAVLDETLTEAGGKLYTVLSAEYTGEAAALTPAEAALGKANMEKGGALFCRLCAVWEKKLETKIAGLGKGGCDAENERALLGEIRALREKNEKP